MATERLYPCAVMRSFEPSEKRAGTMEKGKWISPAILGRDVDVSLQTDHRKHPEGTARPIPTKRKPSCLPHS